MRSFLVLLKGRSKLDLSDALLNASVTHLKKLHQSGNLLVCGPFTDDDGAMLVIEADTQENVARMIQADPFIFSYI